MPLPQTFAYSVHLLIPSLAKRTRHHKNNDNHRQVNVAVVIDGSGSVPGEGFIKSLDFAKSLAARFGAENLFSNGGSASFTQFSSTASAGGTFQTQEAFNNHVDGVTQMGGGTDIPAAIARGRELLANAPNTGTASFMIVITDGNGGDPMVRFGVWCR